ncbi:MAG: hypothetical protein LUD52_02785 [Opitutae bacterium]|nr:hypothetical protein [Opitutae bacterium]
MEFLKHIFASTLLSIILVVPCIAGVFQCRVKLLDEWGCALLISSDGAGQIELTQSSRNKLCKIYRSPDFWKLASTVGETKDPDDISILCAIWLDIASAEDRKRLFQEIFINSLGESLDFIKNKEGFYRLIHKLEEKDKRDPILQQYLSLMLLDYTCSDDAFYLIRSKMVFSMRIAWLWCTYMRYSGCPIYDEVFYAMTIFKYLLPAGASDRNCACLCIDALSKEYDLPDLSCSEYYLKAIERIWGKNDYGVRFCRALRNNDGEEFLKLAKGHFYPAYSHAANYCFNTKRYDDSAYFHYLSWRHPLTLYRVCTACAPEEVVGKVIAPEAQNFCDALLLAERYDDLVVFTSYFTRLLCMLTNRSLVYDPVSGTMKTRPQNNLFWINLGETFTNRVRAQLIRKGKNFSLECEKTGKTLVVNFEHFTINEFEQRYQDEQAQICEGE